MRNLLYVDFETYYDKDYSLSKMQTDAYIKDPRFEIIGVSIAVGDAEPVWYTAGSMLEYVGHLRGSYDWENSAVCCHNTLFDGFILAHHIGVRPKLWMDTLPMGRMLKPWLKSHSLANLSKEYKLPPKGDEVQNAIGLRRADMSAEFLAAYGAYCVGDTKICRALALQMMPHIPGIELAQIDMIIRMFTEPQFVGDVPALVLQHKNEVQRKVDLLANAALMKDVIMSNDKFADHLRSLGVEPPRKISPTTGKETYAFAKTDKAFIALSEISPEVEAAVSARIGVKTTIAETRVLRLKEMAERGPLPVYLNFWGAKTTGRLSGGNQCLTGDTHIVVRRPTTGEVLDIQLFALRPNDLVWDGVEFVPHGGLSPRGVQEVITYEDITGTRDHKVYCDGLEKPVELGVAAEQGLVLQHGGHPRDMATTALAVPEREGPVYEPQ